MATANRTSRKLRPRWLKALGWVLVVALGAAAIFRSSIGAKAEVASAYGAHVACSCHYIGGRPLDQCTADFEPGMELVLLSGNPQAKSVTAYVPLLASTTARYRDGEGCVLEPWED